MLLAVFSALCFGATAQITVTSATFPAAGDTLRIAFDTTPTINPATPPGGNQLWDFSNLKFALTDEVVYRPANAGMDYLKFPGADLVVINQGGETYFNLTNNAMEILGYAGNDPAGFNLDVVAKFSPPLIERRSPMNFFDINTTEANLNLTFSTKEPPLDSIFSSIPLNIDSLRVRITTNRLDLVDGWGNCIIPGGQYPVLRQKRTDYVTTGLDVFIRITPTFGQWVDLSTLTGGGGGLGNFIGTDTTITYRFYSGTEKEEIAVATMSNDLTEVESVRFKNQGFTSTPDLESPSTANIQAQPNPAVEFVNFNCTNLPRDIYTLKIYNYVGNVVWKNEYALSGNRAIYLELEDFKKGTYLYSLSDSKGNIISTKRLVILKP
ncbi:MAG: T9SS type A sorting domain-containing protein [Saprospiraceae bacterium]|nr:T9SS type A sorting domain-containing protein [Saprospiraceae bacterium]